MPSSDENLRDTDYLQEIETLKKQTAELEHLADELRLREALRSSEARYHAMFDGMDFIFKDFNRAAFLQSMAALISMGVANARLHQLLLDHADEPEKLVERRTAELKKFKNAVEHSLASIVITDTHGTIAYVNPFFTRLTGYTADEATGQNPRILKSGRHDQAFYAEMWEILHAGRPCRK